MISVEEFRSAGTMPVGPCSLWPQDRHLGYLKSVGTEITYNDKTGKPEWREQIISQAVSHIPNGDGTYREVIHDTFQAQLEHNEQLRKDAKLNRAGIMANEAGSGQERSTKVKASVLGMAKGLARNLGTAVTQGKVSQEIRDQRMATCEACPSLIEKTKRCAECGCFMTAKTWLAGDPNLLCPLKKWEK